MHDPNPVAAVRLTAIRRSDVALLTLSVGIVALTGVFVGEHIGVYGGYGWDGITYREVLRDPVGQVLGRYVDSYTLQRLVPNLVVAAALRVVGVEPSGPAVAHAFGMLNATLLVVSALLWASAARRLPLSRRAFYIGAVALFLSFANTKQVSYYPVLSDTSAFTLGMALLAAFLARSVASTAALTAIGAFTWPVALPLAIPLLLWPRGAARLSHERPSWLAVTIAAGIPGGILGIFAYLHWGNGRFSAGMGPAIPVIPDLVPLSMFLFLLIGFAGLFFLLRGVDLCYIWKLIRALRVGRTLLALTIVATVVILVRALSAPTPPPLSLRTFVGVLAITPIARPLVNVVAHASYFGPWVLLLFALWPRVTRRVRHEGAGLVAFLCGAAILAFLPESRQSIFAIPVLAAYFAAAVDELAFSRGALAILVGASALATRVWISYGTANTYDFAVYRRFLNTNGPYMANREYIVYGVLCLVVGFLLFVAMRRSTSQTSAAGP